MPKQLQRVASGAWLVSMLACTRPSPSTVSSSSPASPSENDAGAASEDAPTAVDAPGAKPAPIEEVDAGPASVCGDRLLSARETCDDGNTQAGDGCDGSCQVERGYACQVVGARCGAAACGDGLRVADEECDDQNGANGDGCDDHCRIEPGFACESLEASCHLTACGDLIVEGGEQCDDGMPDKPYDGCYACALEPTCTNTGCEPRCGDGIKFPAEACDDGNQRSGDGCSSDCALEPGFACEATSATPPAFVEIPIVYRDFRGADLPAVTAAGLAAGHPDFEARSGVELGLVAASLGADERPVYAKPDGSSSTTESATLFDKWYHDDPAYNVAVVDRLRFDRNAAGDYVFFDSAFFPLDTRGFVAAGQEPLRTGRPDELGQTEHNFSFTSELRTWFEYQGGESLEFKGDDDVWVFVNGKLAVDLGGVHEIATGSVTLDASGLDARFGLERGKIYELAVFQAERHTTASQYQLTLRDFTRARSACKSTCGDAIVTPDEACDDGVNRGEYGQCAPGCVFGPRCGDKLVQAEHGEECDDGNRVEGDDCTNQCKSTIIF